MKITGVATVQITLQVSAGVWGDDCSIGQLHKQAAEEGRNKVIKLIHDANQVMKHDQVQIVGEPVVKGVLTQQER